MRARTMLGGLAGTTVIGAAMWLTAATSQVTTDVAQDSVRATAAPPWGTVSLDSVSREQLMTYATSLHYDSAMQNSAAAILTSADRPGGARRVGPYAVAQPESGAYKLRRSDVEAGRIIGRFVTNGPFPSMHIPSAGVYYVWFDGRGPGGGVETVLVPADPAVAMIRNLFAMYRVHRRAMNFTSNARIYPMSKTTGTWYACGADACCCTASDTTMYFCAESVASMFR